ncbi:hypothetical protein [Caballeronia insecticola]|uniref:hypothetical protein n=1 Tax=Caballeronia insecticola TaxID=758793 RepID=UPI00118317E4|nr:hypothetical protein [Caballeronia insecticola]
MMFLLTATTRLIRFSTTASAIAGIEDLSRRQSLQWTHFAFDDCSWSRYISTVKIDRPRRLHSSAERARVEKTVEKRPRIVRLRSSRFEWADLRHLQCGIDCSWSVRPASNPASRSLEQSHSHASDWQYGH